MGRHRIEAAMAGAAALGLALLFSAPPALAGGHGGWGWGRSGFAISFGWPAYYPYYAAPYYPAPYYGPPLYAVPYAPPYAYAPQYPLAYPPNGNPSPGYPSQPNYQPPPNYQSQPNDQSQTEPPPDQYSQQQTWFYCQDPQGYYPDVESCNTQWQRVPVSPSSPPVPPSE
jgi:hypothetical protein